MPLDEGQKLAHYRIRSLLGQGGMGAVYRAEDTHLGREVALKVLPEDVAQDPDRLSRFRREARAVASLNHPGIVTVHSVEQDGDTQFITMELVEGEPLGQRIPETGMPLDDFWPLAEQLADALAAAHGKGVIHRDLKPANIMVTPDDRAKVLDFGLARVEVGRGEEITAEATQTFTQTTTQLGAVLGTPAYMSPEQARGEPADARSDVFALGLVFYEMLSGLRPFCRADGPSTIHAILNDVAPELADVRREVPRALAEIVARCIAKDPGDRFGAASELRDSIAAVRPAPAGSRRPAWPIALAVLVPLTVVAVLAVRWQADRSSGQRLRDEAIPQIEALIDAGKPTEAFLAAREALVSVPDDPALLRLVERTSWPGSVTSDPPGATVEFRRYVDTGAPWSMLGTTPLEEVRIPDDYLLLRFRKEGYETALRPTGGIRTQVTLVPEGEAPAGMLRVPAGEAKIGAIATPLPAFWIDRYEVTREAFQAFVDADGYADASYWQEPFVDGGRTLDRASAMQRFVDRTGRPGPAGWELGRYPEGTGALPVSGVSWYEAAAYARWAGKELPTIYHWVRAAQRSFFSEILEVSNFESDGPAAAEAYAGIGPLGTYDMAGNVKEWCRNAVGDRRYSQGGGWNESPYLYDDFDALDPFDRGVAQGFRLVQYDAPLAAELLEPWQDTRFDFNEIEAVGDELYAFMASLYDYTPAPLEPELELADESSAHWRRETVAIDPAYDGSRLQVHLFLPRDAEPPYQAVLFRPSSIVYRLTRIEDLVGLPDWIPRSGRALVVPALWGALGRQGERRESTAENRRERVVRQVLDYRRTMDYLATRDDIDFDRVAYQGLSSGGEYGALYLAVEPRYRAAVLVAAGFHDEHMLDEPAETNPWNFAPRVKVPTLIINGENDFTLPYETAQKPLFDMLGTPDADKRMVLISGGHVTTDRNALIRESLAWLDRYLGPVGQ